MKPVLLATAVTSLLGTVVVAAFAGASGGAVPSFTDAQATKGQSLYNANCALCHGVHLEGVYAPALNGSDSNMQWTSVSDAYSYMTVYMPVGNAGGLSTDDYVDIMAYMLKQHAHKPGSRPLTVSAASASTATFGP